MIKFTNILLCDRAYTDRDTGKGIIAGLIHGDVVIPSVPAVINWCFYIMMEGSVESQHPPEFAIFLGGKRYLGAKVPIPPNGRDRHTVIILPNFSVNIDKSTTLELRASINGGKYKSLMKKNIITQTVSKEPAPNAADNEVRLDSEGN